MPVRDVFVRDAARHVEHDDRALSLDAAHRQSQKRRQDRKKKNARGKNEHEKGGEGAVGVRDRPGVGGQRQRVPLATSDDLLGGLGGGGGGVLRRGLVFFSLCKYNGRGWVEVEARRASLV